MIGGGNGVFGVLGTEGSSVWFILLIVFGLPDASVETSPVLAASESEFSDET